MHSWKRHTLEKQQEALQEAFPSSQPMEIEVESSDENEHLQQDDAAPIEAPVESDQEYLESDRPKKKPDISEE